MTRDAIRAFFADRQVEWKRRDADALAKSYTEDSEVFSPMFGNLSGRPAIGEAYHSLFKIFPDWDLRIEDLLIDNDRVAQIFAVSATHVGEFMGLPGTNRRFEIHGVRLCTMTDGLISSERRLYDFTSLLIQLGAIRSKPAG
ncbi:MAG TPA: ester cyclase [Vicinamibacterales bacterium]|nr:ester cyclase [Vicinamibacterales bacterium]